MPRRFASRNDTINPARDLGPRIAHALLPIAGKGGSDWSYAWVPVIGPILGGILGAMLYKLLWVVPVPVMELPALPLPLP